MRILSLELNNFGDHSYLKIDCDHNIVGFIGPSGCGKSTILKALKFALTGLGSADETLPSFIKKGESSASVECVFRANDGRQGTIFRRIGKKAERRLTVGDEEIKADADVTERMTQLMGGLDRQSVINAAFLSQGQIHTILFCGQTERENNLIKLVNLWFCDSRQRMLEGKIKALSKTVVDRNPLKDSVTRRLEEIQQTIEPVRKQAAEAVDYSGIVEKLRGSIEAGKQLQELSAEISRKLTERDQAEADLRVELSRNNFQSLEDLQARIRFVDEGLTRENRALQSWLENSKFVEDLKRTSEQLQKKDAALKNAEWAVKTTTGELQDVRFAKLEVELQAARDLQTVRIRIKELGEELENLKEPKKPDTPEEEIERLQKEIELRQTDKHTYTLELQTREKLNECVGDDDDTCKKCGLHLRPGQRPDPERMDWLRATIKSLQSDIASLTAKRQALQMGWSNYHRTAAGYRDRTTAAAQQLQENLRRQLGIEDPGPVEELEERQREKTRLDERLKGRIRDRDTLAGEVDELRVLQQTLEEDPRHGDVDNFDYSEGDRRRDEIQKLEERKTQYRPVETTVNALLEKRARIQQSIDDLDTRMEKTERDLMEIRQSLKNSETFEKLQKKVSETADLNILLASAEELQKEFHAIEGSLHHLEADLNKTAGELEEVRRLIAQDESKLQLIEELRTLQDTFDRKGLPLRYVSTIFDDLTALAAENLSRMGADFAIQTDPDTPLSLLFTRHDRPEQEPLPMFKLSGGQQVRLSLAFLLAVQQLLLSGLGFVTLDEPSTHQSEDTVDMIVTLLHRAVRELLGHDSQIFLVDHNPRFKTILDQAIDLSPGASATLT